MHVYTVRHLNAYSNINTVKKIMIYKYRAPIKNWHAQFQISFTMMYSDCKLMDQALQHWHAKMAQFWFKTGIIEIDVLGATRLKHGYLGYTFRRARSIWTVDPLKTIILLD